MFVIYFSYVFHMFFICKIPSSVKAFIVQNCLSVILSWLMFSPDFTDIKSGESFDTE